MQSAPAPAAQTRLSDPDKPRRLTLSENNRAQEARAIQLVKELFAKIGNVQGCKLLGFSIEVPVYGDKAGRPKTKVETE